MKLLNSNGEREGFRITISGDTHEELSELKIWLDQNLIDRYRFTAGPAHIPNWWVAQILFYEKSDATLFKLSWSGRTSV
jgi:hypothetical protein